MTYRCYLILLTFLLGVHDMVCSLNWGRLAISVDLHFAACSREGWEL